jgi:hypothetical protein
MARWPVPFERREAQFHRDRFDRNLSLEGCVLPRLDVNGVPPVTRVTRTLAMEGDGLPRTGEPNVFAPAYADSASNDGRFARCRSRLARRSHTFWRTQ